MWKIKIHQVGRVDNISGRSEVAMEGLSMHERFRCGGASLVGLGQFPLLSKVRDQVQKRKVGAYRCLTTKGSADLAEDYMTCKNPETTLTTFITNVFNIKY